MMTEYAWVQGSNKFETKSKKLYSLFLPPLVNNILENLKLMKCIEMNSIYCISINLLILPCNFPVPLYITEIFFSPEHVVLYNVYALYYIHIYLCIRYLYK